MNISVSIVSPSPISREGLKRILMDGHIDVVASCAQIGELDHLPSRDDHLVLLDVPALPEQIAALNALKERDANAKAIILVDAFDLAPMLSCFEHGARGYAVKDMGCAPLIALLQLAALGHKVMPSNVADALSWVANNDKPSIDDTTVAVGNAKLSQREHEVLCCLMAGYSNKRIARTLSVSEATIKVHVKAILRKLNVANRTQAAMWATAQGLDGCVKDSIKNIAQV